MIMWPEFFCDLANHKHCLYLGVKRLWQAGVFKSAKVVESGTSIHNKQITHKLKDQLGHWNRVTCSNKGVACRFPQFGQPPNLSLCRCPYIKHTKLFLGATASCIITARVCVCSNTSDLLLPWLWSLLLWHKKETKKLLKRLSNSLCVRACAC